MPVFKMVPIAKMQKKSLCRALAFQKEYLIYNKMFFSFMNRA